MATNNNLSDYLSDIADAIREKEGSSGTINAQDFSARIRAIETGGGGEVASVPTKAVNFRDYDGTILYSYTRDEYLALSAFPEAPTRKGLTFQKWNLYDFNSTKDFVSKYGALEVGATYVTDDGKTRLYITFAERGKTDVPLYFNQTAANGITVNWGDGSAEEKVSTAGKVSITHHYNNIGDYVITLKVNSGTFTIGHGISSTAVFGSINSSSYVGKILQKIEVGNGMTSIDSYAFYYCTNLQAVSIPDKVTNIGNYTFYGNSSLEYIALPYRAKASTYTFQNCVLLHYMSSRNISTYYTYSFASTGLRKVCLYTSVSSGADIQSNAFSYCYGLTWVSISSAFTSIKASAFNGCSNIVCYDFSQHTSVPTLANSNGLSLSTGRYVVVPDNLYDSWITATNWSSIATYIIKKSDFDLLDI